MIINMSSKSESYNMVLSLCVWQPVLHIDTIADCIRECDLTKYVC